jgi:MOSC domain-containing protein
MPVTVAEIWRYPVKSMGGERLDNVAVDKRGLVADRMWAVRDPELGSITTARRRPALLRCGARYATDPLGSAPEVVVLLPDGEEISSADPAVHARLSELVGSEVRLEPIPSPSDKDAYRAPRETKAEIRAKFGLAEDEPLPDFSVFPLRMLAELSRYVTPVGSLFDAYPVHVITRASLAAMAALTPDSDFDVRRFRPNLVVDTEPGEDLPENSWCNADLDLPNAGLRGEVPTLRCVMPTRQQRELPTDIQVMRTVAKHANRCLGIYATVSSPGAIGVGDEIVVRGPASPSRPMVMTRVGARSLKRGVLRAASAMMPKE